MGRIITADDYLTHAHYGYANSLPTANSTKGAYVLAIENKNRLVFKADVNTRKFENAIDAMNDDGMTMLRGATLASLSAIFTAITDGAGYPVVAFIAGVFGIGGNISDVFYAIQDFYKQIDIASAAFGDLIKTQPHFTQLA